MNLFENLCVHMYSMPVIWVVSFVQRKVNTEIRSGITKINTKIDEANQSLSLISSQLIKPNALHLDGHVTPTATITQPTGVAQFVRVPSSAVTASTSVVNSHSVKSCSIVSYCDTIYKCCHAV